MLAGMGGLLPLLHSLEEHVRSGSEIGSLAEELLEQVRCSFRAATFGATCTERSYVFG